MTCCESFLIHYVVTMTHNLPCLSMVIYPIRIHMCPILLMIRPSQGHMLLIYLSHLMIRTCFGKWINTSVCDSLSISVHSVTVIVGLSIVVGHIIVYLHHQMCQIPHRNVYWQLWEGPQFEFEIHQMQSNPLRDGDTVTFGNVQLNKENQCCNYAVLITLMQGQAFKFIGFWQELIIML